MVLSVLYFSNVEDIKFRALSALPLLVKYFDLLNAKAQLAAAQKKATEITEQGLIAAEQEKQFCIKQAEEDAARLKQVQQDTIRFQLIN